MIMYYYIVLLHILGMEPEGSQTQMIATATKILLIAKFVVLRCTFCKFRRNFGCFCSINHLSETFRKHMFSCDWCILIHFVCLCFSRFTACDRPLSHCFGPWSTSFRRSFLWSFLFLSLAKIKQCLPPALNKNSTHHRDFLCYSWAV